MSLRVDLRPRRGMTIVEVLIAATISSLIFVALAVTMIWVAKGMLIVQTQARRQEEAARSLDQVSSILRNADFDSVKIYTGGSLSTDNSGEDIRFNDSRLDDTVTSRIWTEEVTTDGEVSTRRLLYRPDMSDSSNTLELGTLLASVTFQEDDNGEIGDDDDGAMVIVLVAFTYQSFRDRAPNESRNALFHTTVFMRNT